MCLLALDHNLRIKDRPINLAKQDYFGLFGVTNNKEAKEIL